MNLILLLIWAAFAYCFVSDVCGRSVRERPDRWPGYRLGFGRTGQGVTSAAA